MKSDGKLGRFRAGVEATVGRARIGYKGPLYWMGTRTAPREFTLWLASMKFGAAGQALIDLLDAEGLAVVNVDALSPSEAKRHGYHWRLTLLERHEIGTVDETMMGRLNRYKHEIDLHSRRSFVEGVA